MPFTSDAFITNNNQLKTILQNCGLCYKLMNNGKNIFHFSSLLNLKLSRKRSKNCLILNITQKNGDIIGHWILICINFTLNSAVIYDPLNILAKSISETISVFCKGHKLKRHDFSFRTQQLKSKSCGLHCIYLIHAWHTNQYSTKFLIHDLKKLFQKYSLKHIEDHILKNVISNLK
jgi:hypothetical protein